MKTRVVDHLPIVGMMCLCAISAYTLGYIERELDFDEAWTLRDLQSPFGEMLRQTPGAPLYSLLLRLWVSVGGQSVLSGRLFSLVFALWAVYLIYQLGVEVYSRQHGVWAALLLTLSNFHLFYATEIRMYSMVVALSLLSTLWFFRALRQHENRKSWWGYAVVTLLMVWTHPFTWLVPASQGTFLVLRGKNAGWSALRPWLKSLIVIVILTLPWLILLGLRMQSGLDFSSNYPRLAPHRLTGIVYLLGAFNGMWPINGTMRYGFLFWSVPCLALLWQKRSVALHSIERLAIEATRASVEKPTGYLLAGILVPALTITLVSWLVFPLFIPRYLIYCLPLYYLLICHCAVLASREWRGQFWVLLPALLWSGVSAASLKLLPLIK